MSFHALRTGLLLAAVCGCRSTVAPPIPDDQGHSAHEPTALSPGSEVEVKFRHAPELDLVQVVRPDGTISLHTIGDIDVSGMTPAELRAQLIELYSGELRDPDITVVVQSLGHRHVLVGGAVLEPGSIPMPDHLTVLHALLLAGGPDLVTANVENVIVIRHEDEQRQGFAVNLKPSLNGTPQERPFYLHPKDIVYVPRTRITDVDQWIDQHINQIVPKIGLRVTNPAGTVGIDTSTR